MHSNINTVSRIEIAQSLHLPLVEGKSLTVDGTHVRVPRISSKILIDLVRQLPYLLEVILTQPTHEFYRTNVLFNILDLFAAWNRDDVVSLRQEPRKRDLTSARAVLLADLLQAVSELEDVREVLL